VVLVTCSSRDAGEQGGVVGELGGVLERQPRRPSMLPFDHQCRDLHDLPFAASGGAGVALGSRDVRPRCRGVAAVRSHDGEQGEFGRVHGRRLRRGAEDRLTRC
jgi:hypothetical protein